MEITKWIVTNTSDITVAQWDALSVFEQTSLAYLVAIWVMALFILIFKR